MMLRSTKRKIRMIALLLVLALFFSVLIQFGINMLFVKPIAHETTKGGDGKLTDMLYESEFLDDSYFKDVELISSKVSRPSKGSNIALTATPPHMPRPRPPQRRCFTARRRLSSLPFSEITRLRFPRITSLTRAFLLFAALLCSAATWYRRAASSW